MGNTVSRVGLKPTSLAFRASVPGMPDYGMLELHLIGSLMSPHIPLYPYTDAHLSQRPVQTTTLLLAREIPNCRLKC